LAAGLASLAALLAATETLAQGTGPDIHVFLSGKDETVMTTLPLARDASFGLPTWEGAAVLGEIIRLDIPDAVLASLPTGQEVFRVDDPGRSPYLGGTGDPAAPEAIRLEGEAERARAALRSTAGSTPAGGAAPQGSGVVPPPTWARAGGETAMPLVPVHSPGWSSADFKVLYRPGHRLEAGATLGMGVPAIGATLALRAIASDDLVPSPLVSPSGLGLRLELSGGSPGVELSSDVAVVTQVLAAGRMHSQAGAALAGAIRAGPLEMDASALVVAATEDGWVVQPSASAALSTHGPVVLSAGVQTVLRKTGAHDAVGRLWLGLRPLGFLAEAAGGVAVGYVGARLAVLPVVHVILDTTALALDLSAGPLIGYPRDRLLWVLGTEPGLEAIEPEAGFQASSRLILGHEPGPSASLDVIYASGALGWTDGARYDIARGTRIVVSSVGTLESRAGLGLMARFAGSAAWRQGGLGGLAGLAAEVSATLGFWRASLAAILRAGEAGWPAELPLIDLAIDNRSTLRMVGRIGRTAGRLETWVEAGLSLSDDGGSLASFAFSISLGAP
jgi:hypothetical protein